MEWPLPGTRRVSVNCFGFGGTNAHVILDEALGYLETRHLDKDRYSLSSCHDSVEVASHQDIPRLFCFSSNERSGVSRVIDSQLEYLRKKRSHATAEFLSQYSYTLGCRRSALEWKTFIIAKSVDELLEKMNQVDSTTFQRSSIDKPPRICFTFCGQGSRWTGIEEILHFLEFKESLTAASDYMDKVLGSQFNLMDEILRLPVESRTTRPEVMQPATTAIQIAMVDLLKSLSIGPQILVGHSSGEIAAAYAGGAITREAAWEVAYFRGNAVPRIFLKPYVKKLAMLAIGVSQEEAKRYIDLVLGLVDIACVNSPRSVTLSGDARRMEIIERHLMEDGIFHKRLAVDVAYHSRYMKLAAKDYRSSLTHIRTRHLNPGVRMFSSLHASSLEGNELDSSYWVDNMVSPVNYLGAVNEMMNLPVDERPTIVIELSPQTTLRSPLSDIFADMTSKPQPTFLSIAGLKASSFHMSLMQISGELWARGCKVALHSLVNQGADSKLPQCLSDLPSYPWNHKVSYWHESHLGEASRFRAYPRQDLIGAPTADSIPHEPRWRGFLRLSENPWMQDHQVQKTIIYPASGMICMVLEAAKQLAAAFPEVIGYEMCQMKIKKAMLIPPTEHGLEVALNMTRDATQGDISPVGGLHTFSIYSKQLNGPWERHAAGFVRVSSGKTNDQEFKGLFNSDLDNLRNTCTASIAPRQLYEHLDSLGLNYGPLFQNITEIHQGNGSCTSRIRIPDTKSKMPAKFEYPHLLHPTTLDSMFQTLFAIDSTPMVPTSIESIFVSADMDKHSAKGFTGFSAANRFGVGKATANINMRLDNSCSYVSIRGLHLARLEGSSPTRREFLPNHHNLCTQIMWKEDAHFVVTESLSDFLEAWAHKSPGLAVIQCGGSCPQALAIIKHLAPSKGAPSVVSRFSLAAVSESDSNSVLESVQD